jgi:hypothetical protein
MLIHLTPIVEVDYKICSPVAIVAYKMLCDSELNG